ncbi:MAG: hypothetical protein JW731_07275 [Bacteroidales bacterium]|nr:hypothetical protein [Bacteroidales bacterium]
MKRNKKIFISTSSIAAQELIRKVYDQVTIDLLTRINEMEENHINWAEMQYYQIEQMGLENYLIFKTKNQVT